MATRPKPHPQPPADDRARIEANRAFWNERAPVHVASRFYDTDGFLRGESSLMALEREEVGEVRGRRLLHLQCQFGLDTLSWARLGAIATGVDLSDAAIDAAKRLSQQSGAPARFIRSDVLELDRVLDERFDIVLATYGAVWYLPDLARWAAVVRKMTAPRGFFYLAETHPLALAFEFDRAAGAIRPAQPYGGVGMASPRAPIVDIDEATHTDHDEGARFETTRAYLWNHGVGQVVTALCEAGFRLEFLREHDKGSHEIIRGAMERSPDGWFRLTRHRESIPMLYTLKATAPA